MYEYHWLESLTILHGTFHLYQSLSLGGGLEVKSTLNLLPAMSEMHHVFCNKDLFSTFWGASMVSSNNS